MAKIGFPHGCSGFINDIFAKYCALKSSASSFTGSDSLGLLQRSLRRVRSEDAPSLRTIDILNP